MKQLKVIVVGPGAIGCTFGAALLEAGHSVLFVGRTAFTSLRVQHPAGVFDSKVGFALTAREIAPADVVLLATKAHQVQCAADLLRAACGPATVLAVLQNGIGHEQRVRRIVADGVEVLAAAVSCPADRSAPGRVTVRGPASLEVTDTRAGQRFAAAFQGSFASVRTVADIHSSLWRKLISNAVGGGIAVLARRGNALFRGDAEALALARALGEEVLAVARADGALLDDSVLDALMTTLGLGSAHPPSIVVDRIAGRPTEWVERNRIVVDKGREHGVQTPLNRMLATLIRVGEPVRAE